MSGKALRNLDFRRSNNNPPSVVQQHLKTRGLCQVDPAVFKNTSPVIVNVDANDVARREKSKTLRDGGFTVVESATGSDAIRLAQQYRADLVLLDMQLPDISSFDVCQSIKQNPLTANVLVLQTAETPMLSGERVRGLDVGGDNFLVGPVGALELIANVNALLRLREIQSALVESEQRFRQMSENIGDAFWIFDSTPQLLYVSPAYEKLWGSSSAQLYENFYAWLDAVHEDDRARVERSFQRLLKYQQYEQEYRLTMPDGSERWIRDRGFPVQDGEGDNYRITRISQDITSSKWAALALNEATVRKDEFLATLAHELRNPLAPMRTAIDLMRLEGNSAEVPSAVAAEARDIISRHIDQLVRLVDDLLDVSRITQGKLLLEKRVVEFQKILDIALETSQSYIADRNHTLVLHLPNKKLWVNGDSVRLAQVIGNLLHNAAKYTPPGGRIELSVECIDERLCLVVADNGIGIASNNIGSIFELFTQAQRLPSRAPEGLGVGLSLVKRLVELHSGTVHVSSEGPGMGTKFTVKLPIECAPNEAQRELDESVSAGDRNLRVLLVDDSVDAVNLLGMVLRQIGYEVQTVNDGPSALAIAPQFVPHVIFLDIGLPGMNGYEAAEQLQKIPALEKTTLVALTGYGQEKDRDKAFATGFNHHFIKPVEVRDIDNFLRSVEPF